MSSFNAQSTFKLQFVKKQQGTNFWVGWKFYVATWIPKLCKGNPFCLRDKNFYKNIVRISLEKNCIGDDDLNTIGKYRYVVIYKVSYHR